MIFSFRQLITFAAGGGVVGYYFGGKAFNLPSLANSQGRDEAKAPDVHHMNLKCVQVFFRHGARTPLRHIPGIEEVK
jgi:hypothetical protein